MLLIEVLDVTAFSFLLRRRVGAAVMSSEMRQKEKRELTAPAACVTDSKTLFSLKVRLSLASLTSLGTAEGSSIALFIKHGME